LSEDILGMMQSQKAVRNDAYIELDRMVLLLADALRSARGCGYEPPVVPGRCPLCGSLMENSANIKKEGAQ